jgi:hypothetical protein
VRRAALLVVLVIACARPQAAPESAHPGPRAAPAAAPVDGREAPPAASSGPRAAEPAAPEPDDLSSPDRDYDSDGIPDRDDACPTEPEVYDGGRDDDGCPGAA